LSETSNPELHKIHQNLFITFWVIKSNQRWDYNRTKHAETDECKDIQTRPCSLGRANKQCLRI